MAFLHIGEFVVEGFFSLKVVTFFATLAANYGPLLHLITGFNWLPTEIMAWGPQKSVGMRIGVLIFSFTFPHF